MDENLENFQIIDGAYGTFKRRDQVTDDEQYQATDHGTWYGPSDALTRTAVRANQWVRVRPKPRWRREESWSAASIAAGDRAGTLIWISPAGHVCDSMREGVETLVKALNEKGVGL